MANKIWVLGDAVVDLIPDGNEHYLRCAGGAPANVAVGAARLGAESAFIGRVGKDPLGEFMQQTLIEEQVNTDFMYLDPDHRTSTVIVGLDRGERNFTFMVNPSADQFLEESDLPTFQAHEWLHCCSIALIHQPSRNTTFAAMRNMKQAGGYISFDPNLRDSLWEDTDEMKKVVMQAAELADVLKFSEEELTELTDTNSLEQATEAITALYPNKLIIVTLGALGAWYYFEGRSGIISGKALQPVDTTGAGDAFVAGLLAGLCSGVDWHQPEELEEIINQANAVGALATTAKGAMSALPNIMQVAEFLSEYE